MADSADTQYITDNTWISGTGEATSRINEITGDNLASFRKAEIGYVSGVLNQDNHNFDYSVQKNTLNITDGTCFAYGYFGYCKEKVFDILPPAVESYFIVYVRLDKSVVPNEINLLIKNNYASGSVKINEFRQDVLSVIKTGVYELPLWLFKATNKGIDISSFKDLRPLQHCIERSEYSDFAEKKVINLESAASGIIYGQIENNVTAYTQPDGDTSNKVATTRFVKQAVIMEINR